jgi:predicted O-methyltransferase YrrM
VAEDAMETDFSAWFSGKSLSTDWTSRFFHIWASLLATRRDQPLEVLEIGSWEGRSAIFFLQYFRNCRLTCIDTFQGSPEHLLRPKWQVELPHIEERFDRNLAEFSGRFEKIKDTSSRALARLRAQGRRFDVVYVDGSHHSADVRADAESCWPMIRHRGIVIFDDYEWTFFPDEADRPKPGVDAFLKAHAGQYRELHREYQLVIEKTGDSRGSAL